MPPARTGADIAARMPFVHFPAGTLVAAWTPWSALESPATRGERAPNDPLRRIQHRHVFLYAGPCAYALRPDAIGDGAAYFAPEVDRLLAGHAVPFDTGACSPGGRLMPYSGRSTAACLNAIRRYSVPLASWRTAFKDWLATCYGPGAEARYIQTTSGNPHADGEPGTTRPRCIGQQNGTHGAFPCADRRAWTWEVRSRTSVPMSSVVKLHVAPAALQDALSVTSNVAVVRPHRGWSGPRALYLESEQILEELTR